MVLREASDTQCMPGAQPQVTLVPDQDRPARTRNEQYARLILYAVHRQGLPSHGVHNPQQVRLGTLGPEQFWSAYQGLLCIHSPLEVRK